MGWWANTAFRGAANRSSVKLAERFGNGPETELLALALAYACYPKGRYDNVSSDYTLFHIKNSPFRPCDSKTSCKLVEDWLDRGLSNATDTFHRIWGVNVDDFVRTITERIDELPDDGSSSLHPVDKSARVDTSTKTESGGRQMAGQKNRRFETSETQLYRLTQVLNEYFFYTRVFQIDLAEAAIVWAMAALPFHERRDECKSNLLAFSDIMYASTEDAEKTLSESDRRLIVVAATAVQQHLTPGVGDILRDSAKKVGAFEKDNILRIAAEMLHLVRGTYLKHAPPHLLPNLIGHCFIMCGAIDGYEVGVRTQVELAESIENVVKSSSEVTKAVLALIESGDLVVREGKIVNPNPDSDDG